MRLALAAFTLLVLIFPLRLDALEIYKIISTGCSHGTSERVQTGFNFQDDQEIMTALHGVAGCDAIRAELYQGGQLANIVGPLSVSRADISRDLAVLSFRGSQPLPITGSSLPNAGKVLKVIGFPQGRGLPGEKPLTVERSVSELRSVIKPEYLRSFDAIGSPSLGALVLSLDGNAQIGHSGGPVVDDRGRVIAVLIGGFDRGEFGTSWAVPFGDARLASVSIDEISELSDLRQRFSSGLASRVRIPVAQLELNCESYFDWSERGFAPTEITPEERPKILEFLDVLGADDNGEDERKLVYVNFKITRACNACECERENEQMFDTYSNMIVAKDSYIGFVGFDGPQNVSAADRPDMPMIRREGYLISLIMPHDSATYQSVTVPLRQHMSHPQYRFDEYATQISLDGLFMANDYWPTGARYIHLDPVDIDSDMEDRLRCIRQNVRSGDVKYAEDVC